MNKNSEKELLQSPRIGIENYSRKAFATHLSDSHSSTFSDLTNGFSRKHTTLSHARFKKKGRDKKNKKAAFGVARIKFLLNFQTQKTTQENNCRKLFAFSSAPVVLYRLHGQRYSVNTTC